MAMSSRVVKTRRVIRRTITTTTTTANSNSLADFPTSFDLSKTSSWLRIATCEFGILLCLLASLAFHLTLIYHKTVIHPYLKTLEWTIERAENEETYYTFECSSKDISTDTVDEIFLKAPQNKTMDAINTAMLHGAVVLPDLLSSERLTELRRHVMKRLKYLEHSESVPVIAGDHRWSFALKATEDISVVHALQDLGQNKFLQETIEGLIGKPAALMELQIIASIAGSPTQYWHADTEPENSAMRFSETFAPLYTLLIPLQDTTPSMGATAICPGSHRCAFMDACHGFGETAANATTWRKEHGIGYQVSHPETGIWQGGSGLLYNSQIQHHGSEHSKGQARAALIISFTRAPRHKLLERPAYLPTLGSVFALHWNQQGYLFDDLKDPYKFIATPLSTTLGLSESRQEGQVGWNLPLFDSIRMANRQIGFSIPDFRYLERFTPNNGGVYVSLARLLGVRLPKEEHPTYYPMELVLVRMVERLQILSIVLALMLGIAYLMGVSSYIPTDLNMSILRMALFFILVATCGIIGSKKLDTKTSNMTIQTTSTQYNPTDPYIQSLVTPSYQDVIFPRLDMTKRENGSQVTTSYYHPGNRRWNDVTKKVANNYALYIGLPAAFQESILLHIIDTTMTQKGYQFVERNDKGDWLVMDIETAITETKLLMRDIFLKSYGGHPLAYLDPLHPCDTLPSTSSICSLVRDIAVVNTFFGLDSKREEPTQRLPLRVSFSVSQRARLIPSTISYFNKAEIQEHKVGDQVEFLPRQGHSRKWINGKIVRQESVSIYTVQRFNYDKTLEYDIPKVAIRLKPLPKPLHFFYKR